MAKKNKDAPVSDTAPNRAPTPAATTGNNGPTAGATSPATPLNGPVAERKNPNFSHGPVTSLDLERARKDLEKNRIEFKVERGELYTVDNGDAATRTAAIKLVNGSRRKAG